jgi:hypothetical protein
VFLQGRQPTEREGETANKRIAGEPQARIPLVGIGGRSPIRDGLAGGNPDLPCMGCPKKFQC